MVLKCVFCVQLEKVPVQHIFLNVIWKCTYCHLYGKQFLTGSLKKIKYKALKA